jgi:hypothetical protein
MHFRQGFRGPVSDGGLVISNAFAYRAENHTRRRCRNALEAAFSLKCIAIGLICGGGRRRVENIRVGPIAAGVFCCSSAPGTLLLALIPAYAAFAQLNGGYCPN